ncbi:hypothetical protein GHT06_001850 [Daphnia sinensis]|uniref:Uncharacterized protein n=1 Tax=Daphnia sinensis TaxID=1820382 RepID=A0AAD5PND4_9CRUS|nr:hypothetical protein GHT06_001850 [Daphnia sinensis]
MQSAHHTRWTFLGIQKVRDNYMDCHTGTMDNSVGKIVEMDRNLVNDNKDQTCSAGLHFCSESYLNCFGGERIVIVKINPADVVSIPSDYNDAKGRACKQGDQRRIQQTSTSKRKWKLAPVTKNGSSAFYDGYTAGYAAGAGGNSRNNANQYGTHSDQVKFEEGYSKGYEDGEYGEVPKYQFDGYVSKAGQAGPKGLQDKVVGARTSWPHQNHN